MTGPVLTNSPVARPRLTNLGRAASASGVFGVVAGVSRWLTRLPYQKASGATRFR